MPLGSNRDLLLVLSGSQGLSVANTFFDPPPEQFVAIRSPATPPLADVILTTFGQIDFLLVFQAALHLVNHLQSYRSEPLASHHYLLAADINC